MITVVTVEIREVTKVVKGVVVVPLVECIEDPVYDIVDDLALDAVVVKMVEVLSVLLVVVDTASFVDVELGNDEAVVVEIFVDRLVWTGVAVAVVSIVSHKSPVYLVGQLQVKPRASFMHVPPLKQVALEQ